MSLGNASATVCLAALLAVPPPLAADAAPLRDERASWTIAFSVLDSTGLSEEQGYLAYSIPLLLRDQLASFTEHILSEDERLGLGRQVMEKSRRQLLSRIATLRAQRDASFFSPPAASGAGASPPTGGAQGKASGPAAQLAEALGELASLDALAASSVDVPTRKPIEVKAGEGPALLLETPVASEAEECAARGLDLLVGGSVRQVQGYLLLDLWAFDALAGRRLFTYRDAAALDELYGRIAEAGRSLAGLLAGKPWAALEVVPEPASAVVEIDGGEAMTGRARWDALSPGSHQLRVSAPGYLPEVRSVELAEGSEMSLSVALSKLDLGTVSVTSDPPGADAYLGVIWQGRTPLEMARPAESSRLLLRRAGFYDQPMSVGLSSPQAVSVLLEKDVGSRSDRQRAARDGFYRSFGWFLLSLPIPFFTYGWAGDWAELARRQLAAGDLPGAQRAVAIGTGFYWGYVGGMALAATSVTWTIVNLVHYIAAADRHTN